jgi:uncharacterized protein (TIGR03435 family)
MQAMDDMALLREYAAGNSEAAFETLVSRRVGFVYSMALRQVRDPHLAEEVTQAVFIILAQKAGRISNQTILAGWLFRTTRFAALAQMRADAKRRRREQEANMQSEIQPTAPDAFWEQMSPLLDEALATLGETDRQAVLLRFFENKSLAEVGNSLGTGEDTARKRVSRALEKLHRYFSKRGVSSTTDALAGAISANSVQVAPVALAKSVTAVAITKGAAASGSTLTLIQGALKIMAWTKVKTSVVVGVGVLLAAGTTTITVKEIQNRKIYSWEVPPATFDALDEAMPQVKILPTKFPDFGGGSVGADDKTLGISMPMETLIEQAYGVDDLRTIISTKLPEGKYDYIANLRGGSGKALQQEITRQFGIVGRFEPQSKDVLVLKIKDRSALKITRRKGNEQAGMWPEGNIFHWSGQPSSQLSNWLERFFKILVVDETGMTDLQEYNFDLNWDTMSRDSEKLKQALNEVGFELIPTNQPIEMLVVEKAK